jgi:hypothetical protein
MKLPSRTLAVLAVAGSLPLFAGSVAAAPVGQSMGLKNADVSSVQDVQWRGRRGGRWVGPAVGGFVAGAIVGSALAPRYYEPGYYGVGYYAYGAAPGYTYADPGYAYVGPRYRRGGAAYSSPQYGSCTGDRYSDSGYPSWACR